MAIHPNHLLTMFRRLPLRGGAWYEVVRSIDSKHLSPASKKSTVPAYIIAPAMTSRILKPSGVAFQCLTSLSTSACRSLISSLRLTSSSSGMASISALRSLMTLSIASIAPTPAPPSEAAERVIKRLPSETQIPPSATRSMQPPAMTVRAMGRMIGVVPIIILETFCRRIPVVTLVGQSGPPTRISTFPDVIAGSCSISRIALISFELTPMVLLTLIMPPSRSPISFCCMMHALILVTKAISTARAIAAQKLPKAVCPAAPRMTPLAT
mmetsp:Transcript_42477/g.104112  ORF Transcript_42477/g.104112 Transcript_42477/m.104112 type:complete len:268 (+) Transcript_42477:543-1346(+)